MLTLSRLIGKILSYHLTRQLVCHSITVCWQEKISRRLPHPACVDYNIYFILAWHSSEIDKITFCQAAVGTLYGQNQLEEPVDVRKIDDNQNQSIA